MAYRNVIVADADYVDRVVFHLTVNFERMLGRRIPPADMARWLECVALDGGLRGDQEQTSVVLVHDKGRTQLENFRPCGYESELQGQAFSGPLGEFLISTVTVEPLTTKDDLMADVVDVQLRQPVAKRLMLIPDAEQGEQYERLRQLLRHADDDTRATVFTMQPMAGGNYRQELLGYSLMNALGIRADEFAAGS